MWRTSGAGTWGAGRGQRGGQRGAFRTRPFATFGRFGHAIAAKSGKGVKRKASEGVSEGASKGVERRASEGVKRRSQPGLSLAQPDAVGLLDLVSAVGVVLGVV